MGIDSRRGNKEIVRLFVLKLVEISCVYIVPHILENCNSAEVMEACSANVTIYSSCC